MVEGLDPSVLAYAIPMLTTFVIGVVEVIKQAFERNWRSVAIISGSALAGGLAGWLIFPVIGFPIGITLGLSASGLLTTIQKFGTGVSPSPAPEVK